MYLTHYESIDNVSELSFDKIRTTRVGGLLSLTEDRWKTEDGEHDLEYLKGAFANEDGYLFLITTNPEVREAYLRFLERADSSFSMAPRRDFIVYFESDQLSRGSTPLNVIELSADLDQTLEQLESIRIDVKKKHGVSTIYRRVLLGAGTVGAGIAGNFITDFISRYFELK